MVFFFKIHMRTIICFIEFVIRDYVKFDILFGSSVLLDI